MHQGTDIRFADKTTVDTGLAGLTAGTIVLTLDGELPVEHLSPGDRVITRDTGVAVLREIKVETATVAPVRIKAGSLGHTRPDTDVIVAPGARVHIRDWRAEALYGQPQANVPAHRLIDREFISELPAAQMTVYSLVFDHSHIIYADGLEIFTA
ncbi:Hint domain-containing protein [Flavimaricola marinus]|uniref:Hedgehog/Intein (Hint) domain-containing protein n=1 Tax=Flavimaricola marinus TaxID=1819565 RepID=A0A238LHJ1_9RHOB|nr:Hint domain-containing protein [Flavimaricola marinus]SMY09052.1 hypothetical protein LOM8899_03214 [Flavimaricola marinus]